MFNSQKGVSLLLTLIVLAGILAIAVGVANLMIGQIKITRTVIESLAAYYAAESGIEEALYGVRKEDKTFEEIEISEDDCDYKSHCIDTGKRICYEKVVGSTDGTETTIKARGCLKDIRRSVEVTYTSPGN